MENKAHALLAGTFVLLLGLAAVVATIWLTSDDGTYETYELSSSTPVTGLQAQATVRYKGVSVGKVQYIGFDPYIPGNVLVRIQVEESTPLTPNTYASLNFQGVTGLSFVQLDDASSPLPMIRTGDEKHPRLPLKESQLSEFMNQLPEIMGQAKEVAARANRLLADENLENISSTVRNLDTATAKASKSIESLQNTIDQRLNPALEHFPALTRDMRSSFNTMADSASTVKKTFKRFGEVADGVQTQMESEKGMVANINGGVQSLTATAQELSNKAGEVADSINHKLIPQVQVMADETSQTLQQIDRASNTLSENPQALVFGHGDIPAGPGEAGFDGEQP